MNLRDRSKKQVTKGGKRARGESSSESQNYDFTLVPGNRFLFRDDEAYRTYMARLYKRVLSGCFYFDSKGEIGGRYLTKIYGWITHFKILKMTNITDTYSEFTTRLFYANLRVDSMHNATSYFHGRTIDLSFPKLAELLDMPNDGNMVYPHKNWPWGPENEICKESAFDYRKWFYWGRKVNMYVTDTPALHRVAQVLVNNILTPKAKIKTNIEKGTLFFMKHMIAMNDIKFHIPYILISHMLKAHSNSKDSLPYVNLIHFILRDQGIENPLQEVPESDRKQPKNILDHFSDWKTVEGMLVPNTKDKRNEYLMMEGAAPNQYYALDEDAPEPEPEPQPAPQAAPAFQPQVGNLDHLMTFLTNQFQGMNSRFDRIDTRLDGYDQWFDNLQTQFTSLQEQVNAGFQTQEEFNAKYNKNINDLWIDMNNQFDLFKGGPSTSKGGGDDDDDE